jgi:ABC-type multidrug transport system fused ATPase/permease subunit
MDVSAPPSHLTDTALIAQSTTRSPLFISFSEALVGMSTIRSYGDSARFMRKIFRELDQNTRCFWYLWQTNRVLHNFSNFTGSLVTIFACVFALRNKEMSAGAVGFSISYARTSYYGPRIELIRSFVY